MKETNLFSRIKTGDKKAFDELFLQYYKNLCSFSLTFTQNLEDAEDVVQKVFVRFWENRKKLEIPENPKAFLFKSVYFESIKLLRQRNTQQKYLSELYTFSGQNEEPADFSLILPILYKAIEKLPEKCRQIFILNKLEGLTQKEIAEYLSISVKTVENQMSIAFSKLREDLKPYLYLLPGSLLLLFF